MPSTAPRVTLTNASVDVLNAIRNSASMNYQNYVPIATPDAEVIREIGAVIMDMPALQNEFVSALINRIGRVLISSRMYENPWRMFKLGKLDFGETIEDVFVELADPHQYDPETAETNVERREIPDIRSTFYIMNYEKFYKQTVQEQDLRRAFLSIDGVTSLIAKIVESMYTGANYDEFQVMKYMLAKRILRGQMYSVPMTDVTDMQELATSIKAMSNQLEFMSDKYNLAHVHNFAPKSEQYVIMSADADAHMDVEVLATAFHMDKAEFMGHRVLIDSFGAIDNDRLAVLFADDDTYTELTSAELTALSAIPAVLVDEAFFKIVDIYDMTGNRYNQEGLYWNYWYHVGKTFASSPFANAIMFNPGEPTITSVTVTPATATIAAGSTIQMVATVVGTNFASQEVTWTASAGTITPSGFFTAPSSGTVTITATSKVDSTKTGTATITVG